jgi:hypothetical protein
VSFRATPQVICHYSHIWPPGFPKSPSAPLSCHIKEVILPVRPGRARVTATGRRPVPKLLNRDLPHCGCSQNWQRVKPTNLHLPSAVSAHTDRQFRHPARVACRARARLARTGRLQASSRSSCTFGITSKPHKSRQPRLLSRLCFACTGDFISSDSPGPQVGPISVRRPDPDTTMRTPHRDRSRRPR